MLVTRVKIADISKYVKMMSVSYKGGMPCAFQTTLDDQPLDN